MNITLDGSIKSVDFNGTDVDKVTFNGTVVWEKPSPEPQIVLKPLSASNWNDSWQTADDIFEELGFIIYTEEEMKSKTLDPADGTRFVIYGFYSPERIDATVASYTKTGDYSTTINSDISTLKRQIVTKGRTFYYFAYE